MLSAYVLGYGVCHTLGNNADFFARYHASSQCSGARQNICEHDTVNVSNMANLFPHKSMRRVPKYAQMGLVAAHEALRMADVKIDDDHNSRDIGLVIGTAYSSSQLNFDYMDSILDNGPEFSSPVAFSHAVNNMGAGIMSLMLNIKGGCQTVSQFELSFAGALQTALLLLNSKKNTQVLLGAIDEIDSRFLATCPKELIDAEVLNAEGAVFLLLSNEAPKNSPEISLAWLNEVEETKNMMVSGTLQLSSACNNKSFYGYSPIAHALDTVLAIHSDAVFTNCVCRQDTVGATASITIKK